MDWTQYILFGITILGVIFAVYRTFKQPDDDAKLHLAVLDVRLEGLGSTINKMLVNDIPHIDAALKLINENTAKTNVIVAEKFATLFAILDERIPRK